jgi:DNA invertase Pin-like site-specific DNA recombinase
MDATVDGQRQQVLNVLADKLLAEIREHAYKHGLDETVSRYRAALESWPGEPAGIWLRVSSGKQDEALQLPQVLKHCADKGYRPAKWYVIHGKSAYHGKHQKDLDQALEDMRHGEIAVLTIWHSDRLERRPGKALLDVLAEVSDAGGRVESVQEPTLGQTDFGSQVMTFIAGLNNYDKSKHIAEQVQLAYDQIRANGGTVSRAPWGYITEGPKLNRRLVPTDTCRTYVPLIFQRCIDGDSCRTIARWLDAEHVPTTTGKLWHEGSVRDLIRNGTYAGRRMRRAAKGDKSRTRITFQDCPEAAVIDMDTWQRANDALKTRDKRGPDSPRTDTAKPLLAKLRCLRCGSPMYRHQNWHSGNPSGRYTYRCFGKAPQRKGCGNLVPLAETELIVGGVLFVTSTEPYRIKTWVKGENWDAQIADTVQSIHELDPLDDDYFERHAALVEQLRDYRHKNDHEAIPGHMDEVEICQECEGAYLKTCEAVGHHKETEGEHFHRLDPAEQREFLKGYDIRAETASIGSSIGIHLVIDDVDYGVYSVWQEEDRLLLDEWLKEWDKPEVPIIRTVSALPHGVTIVGRQRAPDSVAGEQSSA